MPGMKNGDTMCHEFMGEVVEVGSHIRKLKVDDRIVVRTNRNGNLAAKAFGHTTAGLFGYTHLTGGYAGGQAEYVRIPYADTTHVKVPDGLTDEQIFILGDIFPTGWQAAV